MAEAIGVVRKVDDLGRIVIPIETRRQLGIEHYTPLEILATDEGILLRHVNQEALCPRCKKIAKQNTDR